MVVNYILVILTPRSVISLSVIGFLSLSSISFRSHAVQCKKKLTKYLRRVREVSPGAFVCDVLTCTPISVNLIILRELDARLVMLFASFS